MDETKTPAPTPASKDLFTTMMIWMWARARLQDYAYNNPLHQMERLLTDERFQLPVGTPEATALRLKVHRIVQHLKAADPHLAKAFAEMGPDTLGLEIGALIPVHGLKFDTHTALMPPAKGPAAEAQAMEDVKSEVECLLALANLRMEGKSPDDPDTDPDTEQVEH